MCFWRSSANAADADADDVVVVAIALCFFSDNAPAMAAHKHPSTVKTVSRQSLRAHP